MSKVNYGMPLKSMDIPREVIDYILKDMTTLEKAAVADYILNEVSVIFPIIDGDNPENDQYGELSYDPDSDNVYIWMENLRRCAYE